MVGKTVLDMCLEALTDEPEPISMILKKTILGESSIRESLKVLLEDGRAEKVPIFRRNRATGRPSTVGWRKV